MNLFEELGLEHAEMPDSNNAFELMSALNNTYGFEQASDAHCVEARILMFSEFPETDPEAFERRMRLMTQALEVELDCHIDEFEDVDALIEAFNAALAARGNEECFAVGEDTYILLLFRESCPDRLGALGELY
jgi:hypothetical protein